MKINHIIVTSIVGIASFLLGKRTFCHTRSEEITKSKEIIEKNELIINTFDRWMQFEGNGKKISDIISGHGYSTVAIYGMGYLGKRLYERLVKEKVNVLCGIEQKANYLYRDLYIYSLDDDNLPAVDVVIVTPIYYYKEIEKNLHERIDTPVYSLRQLIVEAKNG